jgi:hypothetical protein
MRRRTSRRKPLQIAQFTRSAARREISSPVISWQASARSFVPACLRCSLTACCGGCMRRVLYLFVGALLACNASDSTSATNITLAVQGPALPETSGERISLVAQLGGESPPFEPELVTFSSTPAGLVFSPPFEDSNADGRASSVVLVPYGSNAICAASTPDGRSWSISVSADRPEFDGSASATASAQPNGTLVSVTTNLVQFGVPLPGIAVAFSTNTSSVAFVPPSVTTDSNGAATSEAFVPYGAASIAFVSAAGVSQSVPLAPVLPAITFLAADAESITALGSASQGSSTSGQLYSVTTRVADANSSGAPALQGVPVTFTATGGATFTPATVVTDALGHASSVVFVPNNNGALGAVSVTLTAPGAVSQPFTVP